MNQKDIISGCLRHDRLAQHQLYTAFGARILGICKRYMKDRERAEEMAMNTFLTIFSKIGQYKNEGSFEGWMLRIAVNTCLMELRKKNTFSLETSVDNVFISTENTVMQDFSNQDIAKILLILPEGARVIFNLYAIEGYKHSEIAEMLGISEGTSKSQLSYAKDKLKKAMEAAQSKNTDHGR